MSYTKNKLSNIHGKLFEVIRGVEGDCLVLGDENSGDRIAGPKPWGGGQVVKQFRVDEEYGPIEYLEAENANLRKQCNELMKQKDCKWCYDRGSECAIVDRLCKLGIEVPE